MIDQPTNVEESEEAAAGDTPRRSSADAAALTVGSASSPRQEVRPKDAGSRSSRTKGGIIALAATSLLLICIGAFALAGGFGASNADSAHMSERQEQAAEQSDAAVKIESEQRSTTEPAQQTLNESDQQEQPAGSASSTGQTSSAATAESDGNSTSNAAPNANAGGVTVQPSGSSSASQPSSSSSQAPAQTNVITVSVSIDSSAVGSPVSSSGTFSFNPGATPYDALCALGLSVNARSTSYGTYVAAIGGLAEKEHGGMSGWMYSVNGTTPMTACSNYVLANGDNVVWYYVTG